MSKKLSALFCTTALIMPVTLAPQMTEAAESAGNIEEIVVTSRKREEKVFQVPDSITVFTADKIESAGIKNVTDFANLTPNMFFTPTYRPSEMQMTVRGIPTAQGGEAPVAVVIDGVQVSHPTFINQELLDIQQIEVLRGPQGSLYGRNAIGGALNITTKQPTNDFEGMARASYASGKDYRGAAALSGPLVKDKLLFRVSGSFRNFEGQIEDQTAREGNLKADFDHNYIFKGALILNASENLKIDLRGNYMHERAGAPTIEILSRAMFDDWSQSYLNRSVLTQDRREIKEVSLKINYQFDKVQLTSVTDYSKSQGNLFGDADFGPGAFVLQQVNLGVKSFTQELRLASTGTDRIRWLAGLYYQHRDTDNFLQIPFDNGFGQPNGTFIIQSFDSAKSKSWAAFGSVSADITKDLELTVGGRYDHDKRTSIDTAFAGSDAGDTFKSFQPKVQLRYQATEEVNVYTSYARGFRAGGFNAFFAAGGLDREFKGETSDNFEIGLKSQFLDGRLAFNAAGFYTKYKHQQFFFVTVNPPSQNVTNINKVDITGAEFDVTARPIENFDITASIGFVDAKIKDFNGTGSFIDNKTPQVPSHTASVTANYRVAVADGLDLHAYGAYIRRGQIYWDMGNTLKTPAKNIVNLRLSLEGAQWSVGGYVENLTNARYPMQAGNDSFGPDLNTRVPSPKRQYGVLTTFKF
jgi:iron complex outermembrane receptor protein